MHSNRIRALIFAPLALALCAPVAAQALYVTLPTESNNQHKLVAYGGRLYVTYSKFVAGVAQIFVDLSADGRTWQSLGQVSSGAAPSMLSTLVVDPRGEIHVAWTQFDGGVGRVYYRRYAGGWTAPVPLSSASAYAGYPSLDVDSRGQLHLVWYGIRVASEGQPTAHGGIYEIYYLTYDGRWSPPERISSGFPDAVNAALAVDAQDRPHVAWFQSDGQAYQVTYTQSDGRWGTPAALTSGPNPSTKPALAVDGLGRVHIVWEQFAGRRPAIYYMVGVAERWSAPVLLSDSGGRHPTVGVWARGVFALWQDEGGTIALRAFDGQWRSVRHLGLGDYPNAAPWKPAQDARPFAVWTTGTEIRVTPLAPLLTQR